MIRIGILLLLLLLAACAPKATEAQGSSQVDSNIATCPDTILIENFKFSPASCKVKVGTRLVFKNVDGVPHTATALFNAPVRFDTGELPQGSSASISFDTAATIPFHCEIHPSMEGTILVEP